jgi:homopolymeric O-antigen transport system permease protein
MSGRSDTASTPILRLDGRPRPLREWVKALWRYRAVLAALARKEFKVRYKRASLGVLWAIGVPVLQSAVMVFVFSRVGKFDSGNFSYGGYVLAGMVAWFYLSTSILASTTAIVDGSDLTTKVWFPRAVLGLVPGASNLVTLAVSTAALLVALPILGVPFTAQLLFLIPGVILLVAFTSALGLVLSALYVYFRDVKFMVQAAVLVWLYVTPILYPPGAVNIGHWLDLNPLTGIVGLFQRAAVDAPVPSLRAVLVSLLATAILGAIAVAAHRRHDRLFVDQL